MKDYNIKQITGYAGKPQGSSYLNKVAFFFFFEELGKDDR